MRLPLRAISRCDSPCKQFRNSQKLLATLNAGHPPDLTGLDLCKSRACPPLPDENWLGEPLTVTAWAKLP